jgi:hypothetical protein
MTEESIIDQVVRNPGDKGGPFVIPMADDFDVGSTGMRHQYNRGGPITEQ